MGVRGGRRVCVTPCVGGRGGAWRTPCVGDAALCMVKLHPALPRCPAAARLVLCAALRRAPRLRDLQRGAALVPHPMGVLGPGVALCGREALRRPPRSRWEVRRPRGGRRSARLLSCRSLVLVEARRDLPSELVGVRRREHCPTSCRFAPNSASAWSAASSERSMAVARPARRPTAGPACSVSRSASTAALHSSSDGTTLRNRLSSARCTRSSSPRLCAAKIPPSATS